MDEDGFKLFFRDEAVCENVEVGEAGFGELKNFEVAEMGDDAGERSVHQVPAAVDGLEGLEGIDGLWIGGHHPRHDGGELPVDAKGSRAEFASFFPHALGALPRSTAEWHRSMAPRIFLFKPDGTAGILA